MDSDTPMAKNKPSKLKARLPRGFVDRSASDIRATEAMLSKIKTVYEQYGFDPVETPAFEYTDCLGKFLPDTDRPNAGVFSVQDDDEQWMSLRYDLTAPLARHVAENINEIQLPYRTYRAGWVFRNEKPGPGRFRQFMQFDADTVGAASPAADAEMCMMAADTLEALGIPRGQYVIKVNSRRVLDGVMEAIGLGGDENAGRRLTVLRAIDKLDRLGIEGVRALLGEGREDESGDFTKGAGLDEEQIDTIYQAFFRDNWSDPHTTTPEAEADTIEDDVRSDFGKGPRYDNLYFLKMLRGRMDSHGVYESGLDQLIEIEKTVRAAGYGTRRVRIDPSVVRGLEYYTGAVYEAELLAEIPNEKGQPVVFGSIGGGGRYDGLVGRFQKEDVPATGFSLGVSRLQAALTALGQIDTRPAAGPVVVTVMDRDGLGDYQAMVSALRDADIAAELYLGSSGVRAQLKYADKRNAPAVVIQGGDEKARGVVQIKDLALGKRLAENVADNKEWREERPGQFEVPESELVAKIREIVAGSGD